MDQKELVLVLSTGNSVRGQMAAAFLREHCGDRFFVASAGMWAATEVHPLAVRVMKEIGIDISDRRTRAVREFIDEEPVRHLLFVSRESITKSPQEWPGVVSRTLMPFPNPLDTSKGQSEHAQLAAFRMVRDAIDIAMRRWEPPPLEDRAGPPTP